MTRLLPLLFCLIVMFGASSPALAAYAIKITASFPKGTAGEKPAAKYPVSTKISPCDDAATTNNFDAVQFSVTYDASNSSKVVDRDVYLFLFNPEAMNQPKFFVLKKNNLGSVFNIWTRNSVSELVKTTDIYLPRWENLSTSGAQTETVLGGSISLQAANSGIWQLVGIVADSTSNKLDFDDPRTWEAWDVATIMLRKPWIGITNQLCN